MSTCPGNVQMSSVQVLFAGRCRRYAASQAVDVASARRHPRPRQAAKPRRRPQGLAGAKRR